MTDTPLEQPVSSEPKGFLAKLRHHLLHPELTPNQVAWSFALGFSICWNPLLGLHTWMVLLLCLCSRHLHRPLMLIAAFINNPWTMVPIATLSVLVGNLLLGKGWVLDLGGVHWQEIGWRTFTDRAVFQAHAAMLKPILAPYLLGGFMLSLLAIPIGHYLILRIARKLRARHPHS